MIIPYQELSNEALRSILEETISREGTDYGDRVYSMEEKVAQLMQQLERGETVVCFDEVSESCNLMPADVLGLR